MSSSLQAILEAEQPPSASPVYVAALSEVEGIDPALAALHTFMISDERAVDVMTFSELDGFLTAIVIGPEIVMPSEWMPVVWGGGGPAFEDEAQAQTIFDGLVALFNNICSTVRDGDFEPALTRDKAGVIRAEAWAVGFLRGVGLRKDEWMLLFKSEKDGRHLLPMLVLGGGDDAAELLGIDNSGPGLIDEAVGMLPTCVKEINSFWRERRRRIGGLGRGLGLPAAAKVGRNEPCPCGSGKKFKKCCGG